MREVASSLYDWPTARHARAATLCRKSATVCGSGFSVVVVFFMLQSGQPLLNIRVADPVGDDALTGLDSSALARRLLNVSGPGRGLEAYSFIGEGWCRPSGCEVNKTDCYTNGLVKASTTLDECQGACDKLETCIGYAVSDESYLDGIPVCSIYTSGESKLQGFTTNSQPHADIVNSSGSLGVRCYLKSPTMTTLKSLTTTTTSKTLSTTQAPRHTFKCGSASVTIENDYVEGSQAGRCWDYCVEQFPELTGPSLVLGLHSALPWDSPRGLVSLWLLGCIFLPVPFNWLLIVGVIFISAELERRWRWRLLGLLLLAVLLFDQFFRQLVLRAACALVLSLLTVVLFAPWFAVRTVWAGHDAEGCAKTITAAMFSVIPEFLGPVIGFAVILFGVSLSVGKRYYANVEEHVHGRPDLSGITAQGVRRQDGNVIIGCTVQIQRFRVEKMSESVETSPDVFLDGRSYASVKDVRVTTARWRWKVVDRQYIETEVSKRRQKSGQKKEPQPRLLLKKLEDERKKIEELVKDWQSLHLQQESNVLPKWDDMTQSLKNKIETDTSEQREMTFLQGKALPFFESARLESEVQSKKSAEWGSTLEGKFGNTAADLADFVFIGGKGYLPRTLCGIPVVTCEMFDITQHPSIPGSSLQGKEPQKHWKQRLGYNSGNAPLQKVDPGRARMILSNGTFDVVVQDVEVHIIEGGGREMELPRGRLINPVPKSIETWMDGCCTSEEFISSARLLFRPEQRSDLPPQPDGGELEQPAEAQDDLRGDTCYARFARCLAVLARGARIWVCQPLGRCRRAMHSRIKPMLLSFYCILPTADNYSDTAQSISFLRRGQPFYAYYSVVGIAWNVGMGLYKMPPNVTGSWRYMEIIGRFFQADVIEATIQALYFQGKTYFFHQKVAVQAATETVTTLPIVLLAIFRLENISIEGLGLPPSLLSNQRWRFVLDFIFVNGVVGLMSSLLLGILSIREGLGDSPQYVLDLRQREKQDGAGVEEAFVPSKLVSYTRIAEVVAFFVTLTIAHVVLQDQDFNIYVSVACMACVSLWPCMSKPDIWPEWFDAWIHRRCDSRTRYFWWGLVLAACLGVSWPLCPLSMIWPWELPLKGREFLWFASVRSLAYLLVWVWLFLGHPTELLDTLSLNADHLMTIWSSRDGTWEIMLLRCVKALIAHMGIFASLCWPLMCYCCHRKYGQESQQNPAARETRALLDDSD